MERVICILIGYVFGLFQTAYIYGRINGIDIRNVGSGNAGTTNVLRTLGKKAGVITYFGDALKAVFAALLVHLIFGKSHGDNITLLVLYCGVGVVLGHNYPFYLNFKGGKGIAASSGVIFSLCFWPLTLLGFLTFFGTAIITKYVSLGSLLMMFGFMVEFIIFGVLGKIPYLSDECFIEAVILVVILTILAYIRHYGNIKRLLNGTERKIGQKKENQ